jgi:hypothetical protein
VLPRSDFKAQLLALHRELAAQLLELLGVLVDKPSMWARQVCWHETAAIHMNHCRLQGTAGGVCCCGLFCPAA